MKKFFIILSFIALTFNYSFSEIQLIKPGVSGKTSFAIFVDSSTFHKVKDAILMYKNSIEKDGLPTYILIDNWESPDEIKKEIINLYNSAMRLEGVVLIGDIPIPMIRGGQHLTSAFKMDELRFSWDKSSVPSDRFYDDLDLKFEFIKQDSLNKLYYYYRLLPDSPQKIEREIYSARIKPSSLADKYEKIESYLKKVVALKSKQEKLDNVLVFTGHGYNSEALTAWSDESLILSEHFPDALKPEGRFKKYFYDMNREIKKVILEEIENSDLDIAIFHHHGESDAQLLSSYPLAKNVNENIESIKFYLRSKLRSAKESSKSIDETKEYFKNAFGVPDSWFEGAFDEEVYKKDSILSYNLDIHFDDIRKIKPQAKLIIFDACFNGSFHLEEYVAGEYVFGNGNVVAAVGNSVNSNQDVFVSELIGLLRFGFRIGEWHKINNYLESHLFGDPTFRFTIDIKNSLLSKLRHLDEKSLEEYLKSDDAIIRAYATLTLFNIKKEKFSNDLKEIYLNDPSPNVRLMVLKCLAELRDKNFELILFYSINDPCELIRRFSVQLMGLMSKKEFIPLIVKSAFNDESDRVRYNAKSVLELLNSDESIKIIKDESRKIFEEKIKYGFDTSSIYFRIPDKRRQNEILEVVSNDSISLRKKISEIKTFRKYVYEDVISELILILKDEAKPIELRVVVAEVLGWYSFSNERFRIMQVCQEILKSNFPQRLKDEALKTFNRLAIGANNPFTP